MELSEQAGLENVGRGREEMALYNRFRRHISKDVQQYCGLLLRVQRKNKSGVSAEDEEKEALEMFLSVTGKSFRFLECVPILKKMPKFCVVNDEVMDVEKEEIMDDMSELDVNFGVYSATKLDRPLGNKRAKRGFGNTDTDH